MPTRIDNADAYGFFNLMTGPQLLDEVESQRPKHRAPLFPPIETLPDTSENQEAYPQPGSQRQGLGFPQLRLVALLCLGSGALLDAAEGPCKGKGSDEQRLFRRPARQPPSGGRAARRCVALDLVPAL